MRKQSVASPNFFSSLDPFLTHRELESRHSDPAGRPGAGQPDEVAGADVGGEQRSAHLQLTILDHFR